MTLNSPFIGDTWEDSAQAWLQVSWETELVKSVHSLIWEDGHEMVGHSAMILCGEIWHGCH